MRYYELDKEEQQILKDYEKDEFVSVKDFEKEKERYKKYAKATLSKAKNINIRLSEKDLQKAKSKAASKGVPYQTLMTSVIHQYVNDKVRIKE